MNLKENEKIVWKVVTVNQDNTYCSCVVNKFSGITINYKIGEFIKPVLKYSKILVFKTRKRAREFYRTQNSSSSRKRIFKCVAKNVEEAPVRIAWFDMEMQIKYYWSDSTGYFKKSATMICPPDSLFCDELMLLEK